MIQHILYEKWKTCYIRYIVELEQLTVLHFVLQDVTTCYVVGRQVLNE